MKLQINKSVFITLLPMHVWNQKQDTVITGNCKVKGKDVISAYLFYSLDTTDCYGYAVWLIEFPANYISEILKNPYERKKTNCGGGYGCIGRGYLILNDEYYISVPGGYKYLDLSFPMFSVDNNECEELKFNLPIEKEFLEKIKTRMISRKYKVYGRYIELLSIREHIVIETNK